MIVHDEKQSNLTLFEALYCQRATMSLLVMIADKILIADHYRSLLGTPYHQALSEFRAGVVGMPSILRRVCGADNLSVGSLARLSI